MLLPKLLRHALRLTTISRSFSKRDILRLAPSVIDLKANAVYYKMVPVSHEEALEFLERGIVIVTTASFQSEYGGNWDEPRKDDDYVEINNRRKGIEDDGDDEGDEHFDFERRSKKPNAESDKNDLETKEANDNPDQDEKEKNEKALSVEELAFLKAERRFNRVMVAEEAAFFSGLNADRPVYSASSSDGNFDAEFEAIQERSRSAFESEEKSFTTHFESNYDPSPSPNSDHYSGRGTDSGSSYSYEECGGGDGGDGGGGDSGGGGDD